MKAIVVWNSWSRCYAPHKRETLLPVRIVRRQKATPEDTCTDHQICSIVGGALGLEQAGSLLQQLPGTFLNKLFSKCRMLMTGASASCFGERYRDVLPQNLDENNIFPLTGGCSEGLDGFRFFFKQYSNKYRLLYSSTVCSLKKQFSYSTCVCLCVCVCVYLLNCT